MPSLNEIQSDFQHHVLDESPAIAAHIVGNAKLAADRRLAVYRNGYRARLVEALATDYEVLRTCVGEDDFRALSHAYIDAHPSTCASLRWFGKHFPAFLRNEYTENLGELAEFEWALAAAFDAADASVIGQDVIERIPAQSWPGVRIRLHPSVDWLSLAWNTLDLWQAAKSGSKIPAPARPPRPVDCLVWRDGLTTRFRSLSREECIALKTVASGGTFTALCERLAATGDAEQTVVGRTATFMRTWLASGLVSELIL